VSDILYFSHSFRRGPSVFSFSFSFSYKSILILESCFFDEAIIQLQEYSLFWKAVFRRGRLFLYSLFHSATRVFSLLESSFFGEVICFNIIFFVQLQEHLPFWKTIFQRGPSVFIFSLLSSYKSILRFGKSFFRRGPSVFIFSFSFS